jgi:hypothetical protein
MRTWQTRIFPSVSLMIFFSLPPGEWTVAQELNVDQKFACDVLDSLVQQYRTEEGKGWEITWREAFVDKGENCPCMDFNEDPLESNGRFVFRIDEGLFWEEWQGKERFVGSIDWITKETNQLQHHKIFSKSEDGAVINKTKSLGGTRNKSEVIGPPSSFAPAYFPLLTCIAVKKAITENPEAYPTVRVDLDGPRLSILTVFGNNDFLTTKYNFINDNGKTHLTEARCVLNLDSGKSIRTYSYDNISFQGLPWPSQLRMDYTGVGTCSFRIDFDPPKLVDLSSNWLELIYPDDTSLTDEIAGTVGRVGGARVTAERVQKLAEELKDMDKPALGTASQSWIQLPSLLIAFVLAIAVFFLWKRFRALG